MSEDYKLDMKGIDKEASDNNAWKEPDKEGGEGSNEEDSSEQRQQRLDRVEHTTESWITSSKSYGSSQQYSDN